MFFLYVFLMFTFWVMTQLDTPITSWCVTSLVVTTQQLIPGMFQIQIDHHLYYHSYIFAPIGAQILREKVAIHCIRFVSWILVAITSYAGSCTVCMICITTTKTSLRMFHDPTRPTSTWLAVFSCEIIWVVRQASLILSHRYDNNVIGYL